MVEFIVKPWGGYEVLDRGPGWQVKRLVVLPGQRISLQKHLHREEHWVYVEGLGKMDLYSGEEVGPISPTIVCTRGLSICVPTGWVHRVKNTGETNLVIIETQIGDVIDEEDIIRLEDDYGRIEK